MTETKNIVALLPSQRVTQVCLFLLTVVCLLDGSIQMYLGEPNTTPSLDNIHRFMAGIHMACGFIALWTALTVRKQNTLVFLLGLGGIFGRNGKINFYECSRITYSSWIVDWLRAF